MKNGVSANQLFDYLLKDASTRNAQLVDAIAKGDVSPAANVKSIIANNHVVEDESPDTDLDYIDDILGDPQLDDTDDWLDAATAQQITDSETADKVYDKYKQGELFNDLSTIDKYNRKYKSGNMSYEPSIASHAILDRMLSNIKKDAKLTDEEKIDKALRLLYNFNTRRIGEAPADIRASQDEVWNNIALAGLLKAYQQFDPTFMEKERVRSDEVPMTYLSDKAISDDGHEFSLYTPTHAGNVKYNVFVDTLLNDLQNGKAPDLASLPDYINSAWNNKLRVMDYDDWEKELALENTPIDINQLIADIKQPLTLTVKNTGNELYDYILQNVRKYLKKLNDQGMILKTPSINADGSLKYEPQFNDDMIRGLVMAYLAANDYSDLPEDALTPEDVTDLVPDNPRLKNKSQAEKEDNKLNRWHKDNKEAYKKYLNEKAVTAEYTYKDTHKATMKTIYKYVKNKYNSLAEDLVAADANNDTATAKRIAVDLKYYDNILKQTPIGKRELQKWADLVMNQHLMNRNDIKEREHTAKEYGYIDKDYFNKKMMEE